MRTKRTYYSYLSGLRCHLRTKRADIAFVQCPVSGVRACHKEVSGISSFHNFVVLTTRTPPSSVVTREQLSAERSGPKGLRRRVRVGSIFPVGHFQVRWKLGNLCPGGHYQVRLNLGELLPDGHVQVWLKLGNLPLSSLNRNQKKV